MARSRSASIRCSSLAFQMPQLAVVSRRFHVIAVPPGARARRAGLPGGHLLSSRSRPAARGWPAIQASSTWVAGKMAESDIRTVGMPRPGAVVLV